MSKRPGPFADDACSDDYIELPHEDFAAYCRLCFSISQLEPLFASRKDENYQLIGMIEMCTGIKLSPKTDSPSSICLQCRIMMDEFISFRKLCQRLNRVYRRKRNEMDATKGSAGAVNYHQSATIIATESQELPMEAVVPHEPIEAEGVAEDPAPMEITDEMCATTVAPEPSALEASVVAEGVAPESFIVHELSDEDEDDDDVQITAVETIPIAFDLSEDNDDPFIKMANDWYCCKACSRLYQAFPQFVEHLRDAHPDKAAILRQRSKESYFRPKESDLQTVHYGSGAYIKCDLCDAFWTSKVNIMRHRWRYHGAFDDCRKIICREPSCECFFMETKAHNRHLEIVHGRKRRQKKKAAPEKANGASAEKENGNNHDDDDDVVLVTMDEDTSQARASPIVVEVYPINE